MNLHDTRRVLVVGRVPLGERRIGTAPGVSTQPDGGRREVALSAGRDPFADAGGTRAAPEPDYILVIDDDPSVSQLLTLKLSLSGYRAEAVDSAAGGLRRINASPPQLIITDYQLPGMDGLEFVRVLRSSSATLDIPVIVHTGWSAELRLAQDFRRVPGVVHVVPKGELSQLMDLIGTLVDPDSTRRATPDEQCTA